MKKRHSNKEYKLNVGENIRMWREVKGLKQEDLANRIDIAPPTLSNIENGISKPNTDMLEDIADALEIEVSQLLINPQQLFTFNNSPNSNGVTGTQHQHNVDKDLLDSLMGVMEKMTAFFTSPNKQKT